MGWICGVIAVNHLCLQRYNKSKNNEQSISSYNPIKDFEEIINQLMKDEGCETLQDKRRFLKKLECFNFDFGDKEDYVNGLNDILENGLTPNAPNLGISFEGATLSERRL